MTRRERDIGIYPPQDDQLLPFPRELLTALPFADLRFVHKTIVEINQVPRLSAGQRRCLFDLVVWNANPNLDGNIADYFGLSREKILHDIDTVSDNAVLEVAFTNLVQKDRGKHGAKPASAETLISRIKTTGINDSTRAQKAKELGASPSTLTTYASVFIRAGELPKRRNTKSVNPDTVELDLLVAETLERTLKAKRKISNAELTSLATEVLGREITIFMARNAAFRVGTLEPELKRAPRKSGKTWSTSKDAGEKSKAALRNAVIDHVTSNPDTPIVIFDLAARIGVSPKQAGDLYKQLALEMPVPETIRRNQVNKKRQSPGPGRERTWGIIKRDAQAGRSPAEIQQIILLETGDLVPITNIHNSLKRARRRNFELTDEQRRKNAEDGYKTKEELWIEIVTQLENIQETELEIANILDRRGISLPPEIADRIRIVVYFLACKHFANGKGTLLESFAKELSNWDPQTQDRMLPYMQAVVNAYRK